ncbi:kinase-like domain-containing protein [Cladochytrium replicatum]|nr:kinase-like domain-containing protein [Cladochytrium replicatum]
MLVDMRVTCAAAPVIIIGAGAGATATATATAAATAFAFAARVFAVPTMDRPVADADLGSVSLVPYSEWSVMLTNHYQSQIVLYNHSSNKLIVQSTSNDHHHHLVDPLQAVVSSQRLDLSRGAPTSSSAYCDRCGQRIPSNHQYREPGRSPHLDPNDGPLNSNQPTSPLSNYFELLSRHSVSTQGESPRLLPPSDPLPSYSSTPPSSDPLSPQQLSSAAFNQGYYSRFFVEQRKLGRGHRGSVFLCQHILDHIVLGEYAIKKVAVGDNHAWLVRMLREVRLLEQLRHSNIIEYKHAWLEEHQMTVFGPAIPCLFILMERANGGSLEEFVEIQSPDAAGSSLASHRRMLRPSSGALSGGLSVGSPGSGGVGMMRQPSGALKSSQNNSSARARREGGVGVDPNSGRRVRYLRRDELWSMFLDVCRGLAHLHRHGIIHRDLKPPNLLLHYPDPTRRDQIPRVLISDFGECEVLSNDLLSTTPGRTRTGATGTLEFMPPELLKHDEQGRFLNEYSTKADMWSLGILLYYMCFSRVPYPPEVVEDVDLLTTAILSFRKIEFPESTAMAEGGERVPGVLVGLITRLLSVDAEMRPDVDEVLRILVGAMEDEGRGGRAEVRSDAEEVEMMDL